ncbi:uncharacterized protein BP5553_04770 [Venustampulla echinocandica]|uniref:2EXR domain-containing protein n=1 Tax=Venustampulla echinocandica TaxID=2656787 RepID=A0A370TP87_9HELO|nr:uncharacterized protein BP5553_04770 [Venustampulla echinocandica]RDL37337.1 hypothetical protein BP5553_04770 [Venustampulla echinocandica]
MSTTTERGVQTRGMKRKEEEKHEQVTLSKVLKIICANSSNRLLKHAFADFSYFPKLPAELRLMIWKFARPEGRIIRIKPRSKRHLRLKHTSPLEMRALYSTAKVPAMLHACLESRVVAQKWYKLSFGTTLYGEPQTYFDYEQDEVLVSCSKGNSGQCDGTAITWLMRWSELALNRLFLAGEVSQSFMTWQFNSFTGITDLVLIPANSLRGDVEITKGMLRPLKGELPVEIKEAEEEVEEWCSFLRTNTGMRVSRPEFSLRTAAMDVIPEREVTIEI